MQFHGVCDQVGSGVTALCLFYLDKENFMVETVIEHWAANRHVARWESKNVEEREVRTYWVTCADGGLVTRTVSNQWRCASCRVRMMMVFKPRHHDDPQDVPLNRQNGDAVLVGFFDEIGRPAAGDESGRRHDNGAIPLVRG